MGIMRKILFLALDVIVILAVISLLCKYIGLNTQEAINFFRPLFDEIGNIIKSMEGIMSGRSLSL